MLRNKTYRHTFRIILISIVFVFGILAINIYTSFSIEKRISNVFHKNISLTNMVMEIQHLQLEQATTIKKLLSENRNVINHNKPIISVDNLEKEFIIQSESINRKLADLKEYYAHLNIKNKKQHSVLLTHLDDLTQIQLALEIKTMELFKNSKLNSLKNIVILIPEVEEQHKVFTQETVQLLNDIKLALTIQEQQTRIYKSRTIFVSIGILFICLIIAIWAKKRIRDDIEDYLGTDFYTFKEITEQISQGNLDINVETNNGAVAAIKAVTINLSKLIANIQRYSDKIAITGQQLSAVSQHISSNTNSQTLSTTDLLTVLEKMYADIMQNSEYAQHSGKIAKILIEDMSTTLTSVKALIDDLSIICTKSENIKNMADNNKLLITGTIEKLISESKDDGASMSEFSIFLEKNKSYIEATGDTSELCKIITKETIKTLENLGHNVEDKIKLLKKLSYLSIKQKFNVGEVDNAIQKLNDSIFENIIASKEMLVGAQELSNHTNTLKKLGSTFKSTRTRKPILLKKQVNNRQSTLNKRIKT